MNTSELIPNLFRTEYRKIVAVLGKRFGFNQLEIAEDIASDTFLTATQSWGIEGTPQNPTAWLYQVAKNKARNYLQRQTVFEDKIYPEIKNHHSRLFDFEIDLSPQNINDSQLKMMFIICHPSLPADAQIGLCLRILCGFGIEEIANAFFTNKETINKRLFRAKEKLREEKITLDFALTEDDDRLESVLKTIYLIFNEGYYSVSHNTTLRKDICLEALRLGTMLTENEYTNKPQVNALLALMCFHLSRFDARLSEDGEVILYDEQDTSLWNSDLISKGGYFLKLAAVGDKISLYHLAAGIAYWNTQKLDTKEKWENILQLYDQLLQVEYSPIAALNRAYALSKVTSKQEAVVEAEKLNLTDNQFYYALLGELYLDIDNKKAALNLQKALSLARTTTDRLALQKRINSVS